MSSFFRRWTSYRTQAGGLCKTGCEPSILGEMKWKLLAETSKEISPWNGRPGGWENPKWGVTGWVGRFLGKFEVFGGCGRNWGFFRVGAGTKLGAALSLYAALCRILFTRKRVKKDFINEKSNLCRRGTNMPPTWPSALCPHHLIKVLTAPSRVPPST